MHVSGYKIRKWYIVSYDIEAIKKFSEVVLIPLIAAGRIGNEKLLSETLLIDSIDAVASANLFKFVGDGLPYTRKMILEINDNIARWS